MDHFGIGFVQLGYFKQVPQARALQKLPQTTSDK
jgi:hypothetical protein